MASVVIAGNTSGTVTLSAPDIAGSTTLTLPTTSGTIVTTAGGSTVPFALGSAASPSITFTGDTNTGIFSPGADSIGFAEGGAEIARFDSSGNFGLGTTSPSARLQANVSIGQHRLGTNGSDVNYNVRANAGSNASITFTEDGISDRWTVGCVNGQNYLGFRAGSSNMTNGTEQMRIDSSGNLSFNSGYGSVATAYGCRAWVNFNGTGTVAIRASGNVSSISDYGTGNYGINYTTSMPNANYAVTAGYFLTTDTPQVLQVREYFTNYCTVIISQPGIANYDSAFVSVVVHR